MDTLESKDRVEPGSHDIPLGKFPQTSLSSPENPGAIATDIINQLNESLAAKDSGKIASLFIENCYWRDHLCYSWDFRTINGAQAISAYVTEPKTPCKIEVDQSSDFKAPHTGPIDAFGEVHGIEFFIKVTTANGYGNGVVRLAEESGNWKLFNVFTSLVGAADVEEATGLNRPIGVQHGEQQGRKNWQDRRVDEVNCVDKEPAVLIVGMSKEKFLPMNPELIGNKVLARAVSLLLHVSRCSMSTAYSSTLNTGLVTIGGSDTISLCSTIPFGMTICRTYPSQLAGRCSRLRIS